MIFLRPNQFPGQSRNFPFRFIKTKNRKREGGERKKKNSCHHGGKGQGQKAKVALMTDLIGPASPQHTNLTSRFMDMLKLEENRNNHASHQTKQGRDQTQLTQPSKLEAKPDAEADTLGGADQVGVVPGGEAQLCLGHGSIFKKENVYDSSLGSFILQKKKMRKNDEKGKEGMIDSRLQFCKYHFIQARHDSASLFCQ